MNRQEIIDMAREAGHPFPHADIDFLENFAALVAANERQRLASDVALPKPICRDDTEHGVSYCTTEQTRDYGDRRAAAERSKYREAELMAECTTMLRDDLISAGVISESVPPMMMTEAVIGAMQRAVAAEREACAQVAEGMKSIPLTEIDDVERGYNGALRRAAETIRAMGQS